MTIVTATKFSIGQIIHHRLFDYRGVIVDVDPEFSGTDEWYRREAKSQSPKDMPWYYVLVDDGQHNAYVSEKNLEVDTCDESIDHPLVDSIFKDFNNGVYRKPLNG